MFSFVFRLSCLVLLYRCVQLPRYLRLPVQLHPTGPVLRYFCVQLCGRVEMFPAGQVGRHRTCTVPTLLLYFCVPVELYVSTRLPGLLKIGVLLCSAMCSG